MKRNFKPMAALAVCALGALAVSSCTKDEFFGLEDSVVIDASTKYEIAMSQEYADYARACFNMFEAMNQPVDTTVMEKKEINGKAVYIQNGSTTSVMDLLNSLKKAFPELANADQIDFNEILSIALANNEELNDIKSKMPSRTKYYEDYQSGHWLYSVAENYYGISDWGSPWLDIEGWWFTAYDYRYTAINEVIFRLAESSSPYNYNYEGMGGGLIFGDQSAVSMVSWGEYAWPSVIGYGSPAPEADFIVAPTLNITTSELWFYMGGSYWNGGRTHYVYDYEGNYQILWH